MTLFAFTFVFVFRFLVAIQKKKKSTTGAPEHLCNRWRHTDGMKAQDRGVDPLTLYFGVW